MDINAPYNIYKWYNEQRKRWEVRLRQELTTVKIFHSEEEADAYMQDIRGQMLLPERATRTYKNKKFTKRIS